MKTEQQQYIFSKINTTEPIVLFSGNNNNTSDDGNIPGDCAFANMLEELKTKNLLVGRMRIDSDFLFGSAVDGIIEFSRKTANGELKTRIPLHYFIKINQFLSAAAEFGYGDVSLPIDGNTEIRIYPPSNTNKGTNKGMTLHFWISQSQLKESDTTDYDSVFKKYIDQNIFCTDYIHIRNNAEDIQPAKLFFGENGVTTDNANISIESGNGVKYVVGDKVYLHKAFCLKNLQLSVPITIGDDSTPESESKYIVPQVSLNQYQTDIIEIACQPIPIKADNSDKPLMSMFIYPGGDLYLFLNKNKRASHKVNHFYYEPREYHMVDFDTVDEVMAEMDVIDKRKEQLRGILNSMN